MAPPRLPLRRALQARPHLPRRRSRRPRDPALAAAHLRHRRVRGDHRHPARRPDGGGRPGRGVNRASPCGHAWPGPGLSLDADGLVPALGLRPRAGRRRRPTRTASVRWVAISEHEDPTPWLSGGEVVLTTGYNLDTPRKQRAYVARLAKHGVSALGFGIGFDHAEVARRASRRSGRARDAAVRGAVRDALHRDHGAGRGEA